MEHQRSCPAVGAEPTPGCQRPSQNHPGYEICQDCRINVDGERVNTVGTIRNAELDDTCNGEPCLVYHAIPPLYGWVESASDVVGGVRAAQRVQ